MIKDDRHTFKILISYQEKADLQIIEVEYCSFKEIRAFKMDDLNRQDKFVRDCLNYIGNEYFHINGDSVYLKKAVP